MSRPTLFSLEARPIVGAAVLALEALQAIEKVAAFTKQCVGSNAQRT